MIEAFLRPVHMRVASAGNSAVIVRRIGDKQQTIKVKLNDLIKNGDICQNVEMKPGDTLIIPQSWF